jgi:malate synthase
LLIPAPQLVVPSDNARYVLNAVNSRWGSLYDALYGFDVVPHTALTKGEEGTGGYDSSRGDAVIEFACNLLDEITPLATGKWSEVTRLWPKFVGSMQQLELLLTSGQTTSLKTPSLFVGAVGSLGPPRKSAHNVQLATPSQPDKGRIFLKHNGLHLILEVDREHPIGKSALSGIKDITVEAALTAILDMEDSVSAVDAEDKARVYANICGVLQGT